MPVITEFHVCGYCGKKQAGVEKIADDYYTIRCRHCKCSETYASEYEHQPWPWPGGEKAAADLLYSDEARYKRMAQRRHAYDTALEDAWQRLYAFAKEITNGKPKVNAQANYDALRKAVKDIDSIEARGSEVYPPTEPTPTREATP